MSLIPKSVGINSFFFFVRHTSIGLPLFSVASSSAMMVSRVAGVPIPFVSFSFSRFGLSAATKRQIFVIAAMSVPSVKRFGGVVFFSVILVPCFPIASPTESVGTLKTGSLAS